MRGLLDFGKFMKSKGDLAVFAPTDSGLRFGVRLAMLEADPVERGLYLELYVRVGLPVNAICFLWFCICDVSAAAVL